MPSSGYGCIGDGAVIARPLVGTAGRRFFYWLPFRRIIPSYNDVCFGTRSSFKGLSLRHPRCVNSCHEHVQQYSQVEVQPGVA
jgi:hypothetical protein